MKARMDEIAGYVVARFINDLNEIAEKNWVPQHMAQLKRLEASVLLEKEYAEITDEEIKEVMLWAKEE